MKKNLLYCLSFVLILSLGFPSVFADTVQTPNSVQINDTSGIVDGTISEGRKKEIDEAKGSKLYITSDKYITLSDNSLNLSTLPAKILYYTRILMFIILLVSLSAMWVVWLLILYHSNGRSQKIDEYKKLMIFILSGLIFFTCLSIGIYSWILNYWERMNNEELKTNSTYTPKLDLLR